eukprot:PITA_19238
MKAEPSDILLLQETKIEGHALLEISRSKWNKKAGKAVSSRGTSGGLATLWNDDLFQLDNHKETQHWIQTELMQKASKLNFNLFNIYVPVSYQEKRECWSSLSAHLEQTSPSNIIIAGDLNIVLKSKEKRGGTNNRDPMLDQVEDLFQRWDLLDFNPIRGIYTWTNNRLGSDHISARLDRFMVQGSIMMKKKIIITKILAKLASDHKPIQLILEDEKDLGPIPFRFSPLWIEKEGFEETVKAAWGKPVWGSPSYVWEQKLKATKLALKNWAKKPVHTPTEQRKEAVQALQNLQTEMENIDINADLMEKETKAQCSAHHTFRKEEEYWRLKSRSLWLKAGDRNTSYFHRQFRARVIRNHIAEIKTPEGRVCNSHHQIKAAAESYFRNLYRKDNQSIDEDIVDFMTNIPKLISDEENADLCRQATEEEITKVVWAMDADKAPGPDGFSIHFYKACWKIINRDLFKMISRFLEKAKVGGGTNSTCLALIPKESNPESFARFRPISLCNASYKILAKLIANRIKPLLNKLISPAQGGFVEGRNITDNVIQVQEIVHSSKQRKEKGMLVKLDMASAFDRVDRTYICKVLKAFGFSLQFINLIKACIGNPWIAPLVNGRPTNFFQAQRGIRQGCPLSPSLYILMAESLSRKLAEEKIRGNIPSLKAFQGAEGQNHALFADDTILLAGASTRIARSINATLNKYCRVSGALINENKTEVYSWNIEQRELSDITTILGFKGHSNWDSFRYLGLPISSGSNKRSLWSELISKIKAKIAVWGGHWLTKGGKVILIKAVLSALPIYQAAFLFAPRNVTEQISKLLRDFLWQGGKGNENKIHLVKWDVVKKTQADGGLQIRDPALINLALGGKILWKLLHEPTHPVSEILRTKYRPNINLSNLQNANTANSTQVWKLCCKSSKFFIKHVYKIPGNGKHTHLWNDRIMGKEPLRDNEEIGNLREWLKQAGVNTVFDLSKWDIRGDWDGWDFHGVPERLTHQQTLIEEMLEEAAPINRSLKDKWGWGQTGTYTTTAGYRALQASNNNRENSAFWKNVWDPLTLPKITIPPQNNVADLYANWNRIYPQRIPSKSFWKKIWTAIPKFVCWQLWLARNQQIFKEISHTPLKVASKAKSFLLEAAQQQYFKEDYLLMPEEKQWLGMLEPQPHKQLSFPKKTNQEWRIREEDDKFQQWWRTQNLITLFFDGASKGNPGSAGAGGVIYSTDGITKDCFSWGLGQKSNNQAEIYGLLKACIIARDKGAKDIQVFGDSELIIKSMKMKNPFRNASLNKIQDRLQRVMLDFNTCKFYHILRKSNGEADQLANKGSSLAKGLLIVNNESNIHMP